VQYGLARLVNAVTASSLAVDSWLYVNRAKWILPAILFETYCYVWRVMSWVISVGNSSASESGVATANTNRDKQNSIQNVTDYRGDCRRIACNYPEQRGLSRFAC